MVKKESVDYTPYFRFVESFASSGYRSIDPAHPLNLEVEQITGAGQQFFYVGDVIQMSIHHTSKRSLEMMGVPSSQLTPWHFFELTHPDDTYRLMLGRAKLMKLAHDLFVAEKGSVLMSTNLRMKMPGGGYSQVLVQLYIFFSSIPYKSVFILKMHTLVDRFTLPKVGYHYYLGDDLSQFRYPDEALLKLGVPYTCREFEIIRLVDQGLSSVEIAGKLYLSVHTVNTHRRNVVRKSGSESMAELIFSLKETGLI